MNVYSTKSKWKLMTPIKICAHTSPAYFSACLVLTVLDGLMTPFMLFTVARFIDAAITIASPEPEFTAMCLYLVFTAIGYLYLQIGQDIKQYCYDMLEDSLRTHLRPVMIKKVSSIEYLQFETAQTQDLLLRVTENSEAKFIKMIRSANAALSISLQICGIMYAVAIYHWQAASIYLIIMVPTVIFTFRHGRVIYQEDKKVGFLTRQMNYLSELLSGRDAGNERSLFGFAPALNKRFMQTHLFRSNFNTRVLARETSSNMLIQVLIGIYTIFIISVLARQIPSGILTVGIFTSIAGNMINLSKNIASQASQLIMEFSSHVEYANDLYEFMQLEDSKAHAKKTQSKFQFERLEIRNLWFQYADSNEFVLKGVNLILEKGKSYSLVGLNGAGKSTLVKIITGLYRRYEGEIRLNGKNLQTYTVSDLRSIFSVVAQDFAKYYITLADNITLGNGGNISPFADMLDLKELIEHLPQKEMSCLGKIDECGVDISGGEWQKIAIARALYQDTSFMMMDEPTASLSPTAESRMYRQFLDIACNKTLLMISHRLGSTKITDEVIVLDQGTVLEKGSHKDLMANGGVYAQLFRKQSEMYDND